MVKCECGNAAEYAGMCQWCLEIEELKAMQANDHSWQTGWLTGTVTCGRCGLLPIDGSDTFSDCDPEPFDAFDGPPVGWTDPAEGDWHAAQDRYDRMVYGA